MRKIEMERQGLELSDESMTVLAALVVLEDGKEISRANDAILYTCTRRDGEPMDKQDLLDSIARGDYEERYMIRFFMSEFWDCTEQLERHSNGKIDMTEAERLMDEFCETHQDEWGEFLELAGYRKGGIDE